MPAFRWPAPAGKDAECFRIVRCTNLLFGHPRFPRHKNRPAPLSSSFRQAMPSLIIQYKNTTKMTAEGPNHESPKTLEVIREVGLDRLVLETDHEDAGLVASDMKLGVKVISKAFEISELELIQITNRNACALYGLH